MSQILTKKAENTNNAEKTDPSYSIKNSDLEKNVNNLMISLQISPIYAGRVLELFESARKSLKFNHTDNKLLLSVCFYRVILEEKLYISLKTIKKQLGIHTHGYLSIHLKLYDKFCNVLGLKPIRYTLDDHVSNICANMGLGDVIERKAINLAKMIDKNFFLPGEYRTCAITSIYFAANFEGEPLTIQQICVFFELMSITVLYAKIKIFTKYMKEYFRRKERIKGLTERERYFMENFEVSDRINFFGKFRSVKN